MSDAIKEITKHLEKLSVDELQDLKMKITVLQSMSGVPVTSPKNGNVQHEDSWVLQCLSRAMEIHGLGFPSIRRLQASESYRFFKDEDVPALVKYLDGAGVKKRHYRALITKGFSCMIKEYQELGWRITAKLLFENVETLPAVLDRAFPGYAHNWGLLNCVCGDWSRAQH